MASPQTTLHGNVVTQSPDGPGPEVRKGREVPKLFITIAPCPPGWGIDTAQSANLGELAVDTGIWPLKEAISGEVVHTYKPKFKPVEEYLKVQRRFQHLFSPVRQEDAINKIQQTIDVYWKDAKFAER